MQSQSPTIPESPAAKPTVPESPAAELPAFLKLLCQQSQSQQFPRFPVEEHSSLECFCSLVLGPSSTDCKKIHTDSDQTDKWTLYIFFFTSVFHFKIIGVKLHDYFCFLGYNQFYEQQPSNQQAPSHFKACSACQPVWLPHWKRRFQNKGNERGMIKH